MRASCTRAHRAPTLLLACLLCLATGLAILGLATTVGEPRRVERRPANAAVVAVVNRFYAAANTVLRTGDPSALDGVLAPGFVDHAPAPGTAPDRDGLAEALVARHATFPGERLVVDRTIADGDAVAVQVHAEGTAEGTFLGLPLPAAAATWGPLEAFRIVGGAIAEHWGATPSPLLATSLWAVPAPAVADGATRVAVFLERRTYAPGDERVLGGDAAARVVFVEAGTLQATGEATDAQASGRNLPLPNLLVRTATAAAGPLFVPAALLRPLDLVGGDLVAIPPTARLTIRNQGTSPAVAAVVALAPPDRLPAGSAAAARASAEVTIPPSAQLAAGRLVLAPGAAFGLPVARGAALAVVETGQLESALLDRATGTTNWQTVAAGDGIAIGAGASGRWQSGAGAPTILLVVTVAVAAGETAAGPAQ
jgi:predicted ester cyclase